MQTTTTNTNGTITIGLKGRFDFSAHDTFLTTLNGANAEAGVREIVLDLQNVDYVDSSALGMLLLAKERVEGGGKKLVLANLKGVVRKVLEVANFHRIMTIR